MCPAVTEPEEESGKIAGLKVAPYETPTAPSAAAALFSGMATTGVGVATSPPSVAVSTVAAATTAESTGSADDNRSEASTASTGNQPSPQATRSVVL